MEMVQETFSFIEQKDTIKIRMLVERFAPDRISYKPYGITFTPENVYIEVEVTKKSGYAYVEEGSVILSIDALADVADKVCKGYENVHDKWKKDNK
jgi:hypothetical protein